MIKAEEAKSMVKHHLKEMEQREHEKVVKFCEEFSKSIVYEASHGNTNATAFVPSRLKMGAVVEYLETNGYNVVSGVDYISVSW